MPIPGRSGLSSWKAASVAKRFSSTRFDVNSEIDYDADGRGDLNKSEFASKLFAFAVCERPVTGESGEIDEIGCAGEQRGQGFSRILKRARRELA